jgi:hypothetical protein
MPTNLFPMGTIIPERQLVAYDQRGEERAIVVRLGAPVRFEPSNSFPFVHFRCPVQIRRIDLDDRVYPAAGGDAFEALQYAIDFLCDLLKDGYDRLRLENRTRVDATTRNHWIWRYKPDFGQVAPAD